MKTDRSVEQPIFIAAVASMSASLSPPFSHAVRGTYLPKPRDLMHRWLWHVMAHCSMNEWAPHAAALAHSCALLRVH